MNKIKSNASGTEWSFEVEQYKGTITAEEFASVNNVVAVNDNSEGKYIFVGSYENVLKAYQEYSKNS